MKIDKITQQIAAMYLGQQADHKSPVLGFASVREIDTVSVSDLQCGIVVITPHLRRLESITEQEALELYTLATGMDWEKRSTGNCLFNWVFAQKKENIQSIYHCVGIPQVWLYLLSKGFDLFGLIDSGLAKELQPQNT